MSGARVGLYEKALPSALGLEEMLRVARQAGFDFLELSIDETDARLRRLTWSAGERTELLTAMRRAGLPIRTMCLSGHRKYPLGSRDAATRARGMEIFEQAVELAGDLGIRVIQLAGYDVYYEEGDEYTRTLFEQNLRRCVSHAARYGVLMGFETMETHFMDTTAKAMRYVKAINSPYLGVYPDLGNLTNAAKLYKADLYQDITAGQGRLLAMHLKETSPGVYRDMRFGEGHVDFSRGIEAAWAQGVRLFVAECWDSGAANWREELSALRAFIGGVLEELEKRQAITQNRAYSKNGGIPL